MKENQWIEKEIQSAGYKLTKPRRAVISWLTKKASVFSVKEIVDDLLGIDRVSVYRTIEVLVSLDLIHPVLFQHGEQHYELHEKRHHHHAVCENCERTACVGCSIQDQKVKGFSSIHHVFVLTGLCKACM